jgi:fermentation-respiration switch protein FrsA (DUF1100 family)
MTDLLVRRTMAMLATAVSFMIISCNHLFYYPGSTEHFKPAQFGVKDWDDVYFSSQDGTKLHGWLLKSPSSAKATIVQFHGNAQNLSSHFAYVAWLTEAGFDVFVFDYRGYGKSEGTPERSGIVQDGIAAIEWARGRDLDIVIIGQSLGAAVAVPALVAAGQNRVRGLVLDSSFSSYRTIAKDKLASLWLTWPLQWPLSLLITDELSPQDSIDQIRVPILFLHSSNDLVVPEHLGRKLFERAPDKPGKEFYSDETPGHVVTLTSDRGRAHFLSWLDRSK